MRAIVSAVRYCRVRRPDTRATLRSVCANSFSAACARKIRTLGVNRGNINQLVSDDIMQFESGETADGMVVHLAIDR